VNALKLGEHFICDFSECDMDLLLDGERAYGLFSEAVRASGLTVVDEGFYKFAPHGFTCFLLLAESHASLHAWPEYGYCAIDLFTCSLELNVEPLVRELTKTFGAKRVQVRLLDRQADVENIHEPA
jgi:S-adenosylmethionine decarboxylase